MDSTGITPVMDINRGYGYGDGFGFGGNGLWLFAILALMWGGNGFFGNRGYDGLGYRPATAEDVNNGFNFSELQSENRDILSAISGGTAQAVAATNQAKYDNINVAKDIQNALTAQIGEVKTAQVQSLAHQTECCCNTLRAIDGVNYNGALNTASINANTTAVGQKVLDALAAEKAERQAARINELERQIALQGVVRYPLSMTYGAGPSPFCAGCGGYGNI